MVIFNSNVRRGVTGKKNSEQICKYLSILSDVNSPGQRPNGVLDLCWHGNGKSKSRERQFVTLSSTTAAMTRDSDSQSHPKTTEDPQVPLKEPQNSPKGPPKGHPTPSKKRKTAQSDPQGPPTPPQGPPKGHQGPPKGIPKDPPTAPRPP